MAEKYAVSPFNSGVKILLPITVLESQVLYRFTGYKPHNLFHDLVNSFFNEHLTELKKSATNTTVCLHITHIQIHLFFFSDVRLSVLDVIKSSHFYFVTDTISIAYVE